MKRLLLWIRVIRKLKKLHNKNPISHLHSFWLQESALIGYLFSKFHKVKHLTTLMGQDVQATNMFAKRLPLDKMLLITLSDFQQTQLRQNFGVDAPVIPWGINARSVKAARPRDIDILGVGSLIGLKRFDLLIATVALLREKFPDIKAVIAGKGIEEARLKKQVKALGLSDQVKFYGEVGREEVWELMSRAKVLLHASEFESYGMVFTEALAHGMRIVSRKVGIAQQSEYWSVFDREEDIAQCCSRLLEQAWNEKQGDPAIHNIDNTVQVYLKHYYSH